MVKSRQSQINRRYFLLLLLKFLVDKGDIILVCISDSICSGAMLDPPVPEMSPSEKERKKVQ
eukprot:2428691-Ditylum_brightwellii.AAC.1